MKLLTLVVCPRNHTLVKGHNNRADRNLVLGSSNGCLFERHFHVQDVKRMARVAQRQIQGGNVQLSLPNRRAKAL